MVVASQYSSILDNLPQIKTCKTTSNISTPIPVVDLSDPDAKPLIVEACKEFGFFKAINHGVSMEFLAELEGAAVDFFKLPQDDKEKSGPPSPFGYGSKRIGPNGDTGWVEYLLFPTNSELIPGVTETLRVLVNDYVSRVRNLACDVLELIAEELQMGAKDTLSKLIRDEKSDSCFRLNHYPPCPFPAMGGWKLIGFGEHTDPQILSVLRSNNISGLQICLKDGSWVPVPPDETSLFFNVGDSLQVLTNGRFQSVKHRALAEGVNSRLSMIFFGGPPLDAMVGPVKSVMKDDEESLYKEITWADYKKSAYKTRLGHNRLAVLEKFSAA